jgi:hypothetical protein
MEQKKPQQSDYSQAPLQNKEYQAKPNKKDQAKPNKNKTGQLHINFHNPNTAEETAEYLSKLIIRNLAEVETAKDDTIDR